MHDNEFEWDDDKAAANLVDHKIDFEMARHVFDDPFVLIRADASEDSDEDRYLATGSIGGRLVTIVFTERCDRTRIISAWKASNHEQRAYHAR